MSTDERPLRLGTRGSNLARAQSSQVARALHRATGRPVELKIISTRGDRDRTRPLAALGGKGLFTAELEAELREGTIELAVHSLKDLPTEDPDGLVLAAIPTRADPRDVIVGAPLEALPVGAVVGTGSLRRKMQVLARRPDLAVRGIRGNVETRLRKRDEGDYDAVILAKAGLDRLGITRDDITPFSPGQMVPAVGQGALGVQGSLHRPEILVLLKTIDDPVTRRRVAAERAFLRTFGGGCNVAAACYARVEAGDVLHLRAVVQQDDGEIKQAEARGVDGPALGRMLAETLRFG
ncbi:MAG: hydroxymethylbilane synthase [Myxococcota bacterium]